MTTPHPAATPAQGEPRAASVASVTPLQAAWSVFWFAMQASKPRELRTENSDAALEGRVCDTDAIVLAMRDYLKALVEDTAIHVALAKRPDDIVDSHMTDMAGDLRGHLLQALERNAA